uniref:Helicase ATP-binding domain-containing protein n=1 Tax=Sinocyclocheilus grahami TaxID=75366 RepID=A0A672PSX3_SINGR
MVFLKILMERSRLPVKNFKEQIMSTIHDNPVVIIQGATGCGKTTQIPQYILDEFIQAGRASECNIVVTQVSLLKCVLILCARSP